MKEKKAHSSCSFIPYCCSIAFDMSRSAKLPCRTLFQVFACADCFNTFHNVDVGSSAPYQQYSRPGPRLGDTGVNKPNIVVMRQEDDISTKIRLSI